MKFGTQLQEVRIAIYVFYSYRIWPFELHTSGYKFSARKNIEGRFVWNYGSPDPGPYDPDHDNRLVFLVPFIGNIPEDEAATSVPEFEKMITDQMSLNKKLHQRIIISKILTPNTYMLNPALKDPHLWPQ